MKVIGLEKCLKKIHKYSEEVVIDEVSKVYLRRVLQVITTFSVTGNLKRSFDRRYLGRKAIVSSNSKYAAIRNYGGKIKITDKLRKKMFALYKETNNKMFLAIAITKKDFIVIKPKDYLEVDKKYLVSRARDNIRRKLNNKKLS